MSVLERENQNSFALDRIAVRPGRRSEPEAAHDFDESLAVRRVADSRFDVDADYPSVDTHREANGKRASLHGARSRQRREESIPHDGWQDTPSPAPRPHTVSDARTLSASHATARSGPGARAPGKARIRPATLGQFQGLQSLRDTQRGNLGRDFTNPRSWQRTGHGDHLDRRRQRRRRRRWAHEGDISDLRCSSSTTTAGDPRAVEQQLVTSYRSCLPKQEDEQAGVEQHRSYEPGSEPLIRLWQSQARNRWSRSHLVRIYTEGAGTFPRFPRPLCPSV